MPDIDKTVLPSSLPFYKDETNKVCYALVKQEPSSLQILFKTTRESLNLILETVTDVRTTGIAQGALSELREEENLVARGAVIGGATLLGLIVGSVRGRRVSRVLYSLVGGGAGVAVCYPQAASELDEVARNTVKVISGDGSFESLSLSLPVIDPVVVMDTMKSFLEILSTKCAEFYHLAVDVAQPATPKSSLVAENQRAVPTVVFLPPSSLTPSHPVEGDPGMGTEEDSDMYTTRG